MIGHRAFSVEDYFALLRRRWWWILIPAILGPIAGYELARFMPPEYESKTLVAIEAPEIPSDFVTPAVPDYLMMERFGDMEEEILSNGHLNRLVGQFRDQGGTPAGSLKKAIVLAPSYSSLETGDAKRPVGFTITCTFHTAQAAQSICSDVASIFMEEDARSQEQTAQATTDFLTAQLADAKRGLDQQDASLAAFKRQYMNVLPDEVQTNLNLLSSATMQLEGVTEALTRAQSDQEYNESLLAQQITAWQDEQHGTVGPQPLRVQIGSMETELADLQAKYSNTYPDVIDLKNRIAYLTKLAEAEEAEQRAKPKPVQKVKENPLTEPPLIEQLRNQIRLNAISIAEEKKQQQRLQQQIADYQSRVQLSPAVEEQYSEITRNHQSALDAYNSLLRRLETSRMAGALEQGHESQRFRIIEPATFPTAPVSMYPLLFGAGGFAGGLVLGLAIVLLIEFRDKSIWNEDDIDSCVQLLTLATLPLVDHPKWKLQDARAKKAPALLDISSPNGAHEALAKSTTVVLEPPAYSDSTADARIRDGVGGAIPYGTPEINRFLQNYAKRHDWKPDTNTILLFDGLNSAFGTEELRTLRTQLELLRRQQRVHSLLITSPMPMEGKTFTALNLSLAIACQPNRRLLLIDADMRAPQLHRALGAPLTPGLSEYLSGTADELSIIQRGSQGNLFFIPAGKPASNPSDLIGNGRLKLLVRRMAPAFDWIIFDSPPAVPVSDAQLLAEVCDGVVVIFRSGATPFDLAQRACAQFGEKQLLGVVLNRVKPAAAYNSYYRKVAVYHKSSG
jgi:polysaccharide chain length determinant protein (PEP-CTERM system associated)